VHFDPAPVAQASKPAVAQVSKPADGSPRTQVAASLPGQLLYLLGRHGLAAHGDRSHFTRPW